MAVPQPWRASVLRQWRRPDAALLLFLDFDGTLVPIAPDPSVCFLTPEVHETLAKLASQPNCRVAIISGRALSDLQSRVGIAGLALAGNHGLEIALDNRLVFQEPRALQLRPLLRFLLRQLASVCKDYRGSWVEDKGLTLTVHFRQTEDALHDAFFDRVSCVCQPHVTAGEIVVRAGKKVLEVRPAVDWHKGSATRWLASYWALPGNPQVLTAGDDATDEDFFAAWPGECHIHVGLVANSLAPWYLAQQAEVPGLLQDVLACLAELPVRA